MSDIEDRIRSRAYKLWEEEGYPDGRAEAHWEKARALIDAEEREPPGGASRAIAQEGFAGAGASGVGLAPAASEEGEITGVDKPRARPRRMSERR